MKTYGKFKRSTLQLALLQPDNKSDVEFSSDSDNDTGVLSSIDTHSIGKNVSPPPKNVGVHSENVTIPASSDNNSTLGKGSTEANQDSLSVFDFMSKTISPKVKRRKTRYTLRRPTGYFDESVSGESGDNIQDRGSEKLNDIINNVNEFLDGLQPKNEDPLLHMFEEQAIQGGDDCSKEDEDSNQQLASASGRVYDKRRTLLIDRKGEEDMEDTILEEYNEALEDEKREEEKLESSLSPDEHRLTQGRLYHYNELKNMGQTLSYQEDLDFLMSSVSPNGTVEDFMSTLLAFSSSIDTNEPFKCYLLKNHSLEICQKCLTRMDLDSLPLLLVQSYILNTFLPQAGDSAPKKLPKNISTLLLSASRYVESVDTLQKGNKLLRLNYKDFVQRCGKKSGVYYAVNIWCKCFDYFSVSDRCKFFRRSFDIINKSIPHSVQEKLLEFIELMLLDKQCEIEVWNEPLIPLSEDLLALFPQHANNEHLVKCLILLTNKPDIVGSIGAPLQNSTIGILIHSICTLYSKQPKSGRDADVLLLHLGLALNILSETTARLKEVDELWDAMRLTVSDGVTTHDFTCLLLYLCFCYLSLHKLRGQHDVTQNSGTSDISGILPSDLKKSMVVTLEEFGQTLYDDNDNENGKKLNSTIGRRVNYILDVLNKRRDSRDNSIEPK